VPARPRRELSSERPRVIIVTGASSGVGRAVAHQLARQGACLVLCSRGKTALEAAASECRQAGARAVTAHPLDVRDGPAVSALVDAVVAEHGHLDAVVHAAGVVAYGRFEDIPAEIFDGVIATNVLGSANIARAVLPVFRRQRAGTLQLVGSVVGEIAVPGMTPYAVSKWAVRNLGRQLALENRDLPHVRITTVSLGSVDTPIYRQSANYEGRAGRPPAPVVRPERVARVMVDALDSPRQRVSIGPVNAVMRVGFSLAPRAFDVLVGPLVSLIARRPGHQEPTAGNVLEPVVAGEAVRGGESQGLHDFIARLGKR
jgi:NAD(P)-dependent dehydrogenase (short-subunit alcohol dehydrogenase family)